MCAHNENDPEFREWPPHCVAGTAGQLKPQQTLLEKRVVIPARPGDYPIDGAEQILLEKQQLDLFTNPNLAQLLSRLAADRYVVYGVVTEYCVRLAALGLLKTGKPVSVVTDAIQALSQQDCDRTLQEITSSRGKLTTVAEVCGAC
jgi:nicotinamidase/pyrazinamidase